MCAQHVWLFATPWTLACQASCTCNFPDKNSGILCHFLFQGTFPTQRSNPYLLYLLHWQAGSLPLYLLGNHSPWILTKLKISNVFDTITACYFYKLSQIIKRVGRFPRELALLWVYREFTHILKMIKHLKLFFSQDPNKWQ